MTIKSFEEFSSELNHIDEGLFDAFKARKEIVNFKVLLPMSMKNYFKKIQRNTKTVNLF